MRYGALIDLILVRIRLNLIYLFRNGREGELPAFPVGLYWCRHRLLLVWLLFPGA